MWLWGGEGWGGEGWSAVRGRGRGCGDGEERGGEGRAHRNTGSKVVWGQFYDSRLQGPPYHVAVEGLW